jgi:hypothetical protein
MYIYIYIYITFLNVKPTPACMEEAAEEAFLVLVELVALVAPVPQADDPFYVYIHVLA